MLLNSVAKSGKIFETIGQFDYTALDSLDVVDMLFSGAVTGQDARIRVGVEKMQ